MRKQLMTSAAAAVLMAMAGANPAQGVGALPRQQLTQQVGPGDPALGSQPPLGAQPALGTSSRGAQTLQQPATAPSAIDTAPGSLGSR